MNYISDILYWISTGLLVPVIVILIYLFIRSLLLLGIFFGQYMQAARIQEWIKTNLKGKKNVTLSDLAEMKGDSQFSRTLKELMNCDLSKQEKEFLLSSFELETEKDLAKSRIMAKMGPILGLMGTLIPMGPALVGLAQGDIASMAYNMQVAFATTVVGLFVAAVGYISQQLKQRWYYQQLSSLEFISEID